MCGVLTWGSPLLKIYQILIFSLFSLSPVSGACPREFLLYFFNKVYFFFMVPDTSWYQICFSSLFINSPDQEQLTLY